MKTLTLVASIFSVAVAVATVIPAAQAQDDGAKPVPIEAFFCNFQEGKNLEDLQKVSQKFSQWSDKNQPDYSAWILTPQFGQLDELPDMVWLGSSSSGNATGKAMDVWQSKGGDLQQSFNEVIDCDSHVLVSSIEINAPDGPPANGVVMFNQCDIAEGSDWEKAVAGQKKYATTMRGLGAKNSNWLFFPMLGGAADNDLDYWNVVSFNSWTDYFDAYELYVNGGGWQKGMEIMNGVANCKVGTPTVWNAKLVRQGTS